MERVDWPALLRAVAEAAPNDDAGDQPITLDLTDCPARLVGDAALLELCVHNLLGNALKYSPPGGWVDLRAWTEQTENGRALAVLAVTDQGIGVPPDALPHIFDRFFRAPNASGAAGSGVGLNMVRRIATLHGGTIQVDSQLGVGSRFTLTLPTAGPDQDADQDADEDGGMAAIAESPSPNHSPDR
jgi:signal transduction histidine kinase